MIDSPTGAPSTEAPGMLTCGTPVNPPWLVRQADAVAQRVQHAQFGSPLQRRRETAWSAGTGWCRGASSSVQPGACLDAHQRRRPLRSASVSMDPCDQRAGHAKRQTRVVAGIEPGFERCARLSLLWSTRCARCHTERPCGAMVTSLPVADQLRRGGPGAGMQGLVRAVLGSEAECVGRHEAASAASVEGIASRRTTLPADACEHRRRPVRTSRMCPSTRRLHGDAGEVDPAMGWPHAIQAAEAGRHAHGAAAIGAQARSRTPLRRRPRRIRSTTRRARDPGAAGLSGVPSCAFSPRIPSETSSVMVLPTTDWHRRPAAPAPRQACRVGVVMEPAANPGCRRRWARRRGRSGP